jgi:hypothetical protein
MQVKQNPAPGIRRKQPGLRVIMGYTTPAFLARKLLPTFF